MALHPSNYEKTVADHVKAKGGALRDRKTRLNLRLGYGRRHGVYVSMSTLSTLNCVVCVCVFVCVIIGRMQRHIERLNSCQSEETSKYT
jgi:hypothetical protein